MDKKVFQEDLRTLNQGKKERRSNTALVADVMDDIEAALARGVRREVILQALQKQGVTLTLQGFQSALRDLRKRKKEGKLTPQTSAAKSGSPVSSSSKTNPNSLTLPQNNQSTTGSPKPTVNIPGYVSKVTDKDREEYQAFKESIKDLPDRERRKKLEDWREKRENP